MAHGAAMGVVKVSASFFDPHSSPQLQPQNRVVVRHVTVWARSPSSSLHHHRVADIGPIVATHGHHREWSRCWRDHLLSSLKSRMEGPEEMKLSLFLFFGTMMDNRDVGKAVWRKFYAFVKGVKNEVFSPAIKGVGECEHRDDVRVVEVVISPENTVADLIKAALASYMKEKRRSLLKNNYPKCYYLHYSSFALQSK
ncbi:hypothetical protein V8G54_010705 [Vigna mungo]|uniref:DUF7054 domain-containing protein n=1 Tax=Vigna mungo TaxID=3915 RepID=A0AAQ3P0K1_VIGMU